MTAPSTYLKPQVGKFDFPVLIIEVTAARYPEVETALQAKEDGNPAPTYRLIRDHLRSADQRDKARKRKGTKSPLRRAVQRMIPYLPSRRFEHLLDVFRNDDAMLDLYESLSNPIDIRIQEVLDNKQRIDYRVRGGKERSVTFSRLKEIFRLCP